MALHGLLRTSAQVLISVMRQPERCSYLILENGLCFKGVLVIEDEVVGPGDRRRISAAPSDHEVTTNHRPSSPPVGKHQRVLQWLDVL